MTKRRYVDGCALAHALDLIGERWALLVIRELTYGPKRFSDLRTTLPDIGPSVLSSRLSALTENAIISVRQLPAPAASRVYELTEWGAELMPAMQALGRWGARSPTRPRDPMSVAAFKMSLETMFDPEQSNDVEITIGLEFADECALATVSRKSLLISAGDIQQADAILSGEPKGMADAVYLGRHDDNELKIMGDLRAVDIFKGIFSVPDPALGTHDTRT